MRDLQNRVLILLGAMTIALMGLGIQLYRLTVAESAAWATRATAQTQKELASHGPRGFIFDRAGRVLASSEPVFAALLTNQDPEHVERILPSLAILLADGNSARAEQITTRVRTRVREHVDQWRQFEDLVIATNLPQHVVAAFVERRSEFPGVSLVIQSARRYPEGHAASPVLGYVGPITADELKLDAFGGYQPDAVVGKAGLEKSYEQLLQGKPGTRSKVVDVTGRPVGATQEVPAEPGHNLLLTLDLELQRAAEQALQKQMAWIRSQNDKEANPIRGAVVALDVRTGAVLAMVSFPTFDPNLFVVGMSQEEYDRFINIPSAPLVNWAITGFAPGSTYKMGVGLAGVEAKKIGYYDTIHCDATYFRDRTRGNWTGYDQGRLYLAQALAQSCNPYFYEMGHLLGIDELAAFLDQFGFGHRTGIDLPGEDPGTNPTKESYGPERWQPGHVYSVSIGQGDVKVSPLQLASYTATIAGDGQRLRPYLVAAVKTHDGELIHRQEPVKAGEVKAAAESWKQVRYGMWMGANHPTGTAYRAFLGFPMQVAAKTGSAETGLGYTNALTVAYAPADNPQIAVAVLVEGGAHGSWVAPVARAVFAQYFGIVEAKENLPLNKAD